MGQPLSVIRGERRPGQRWTDRDALLLQALTYYEASLCSGCGQPMWLGMDPDTEGHWKAPLPTRCHPCTAIAIRMKDYEEADQASALRFSAELVPAQ